MKTSAYIMLTILLGMMGGCGGKKSPTGPGGERIEVIKEFYGNGQVSLEYEVYRDKSNNRPMKHGYYKSYFPDGTFHKVGSYFQDLEDGLWTEFYTNGKKHYEGTFVRGAKEGPFVAYDENGLVKWSGSYKADLMDGVWGSYTDGKKVSETSYVSGKKEGPYVLYSDSGIVLLRGSYKADLMDGEWTFYDQAGSPVNVQVYNLGQRWTGTWFEDISEAVKTVMFQYVYEELGYSDTDTDDIPVVAHVAVEKAQMRLKDGLKEGIWIYFYDDEGTRKALEVSYAQDHMTGHRRMFYPDGITVMEEGELKEGLPDGLWTYYYPTGVKKQERSFQNGERDGWYSTYYGNGQRWYEGYYVNGERNGPYTAYYENGNKSEEGNQIGDKITGNYALYWPSGTLQFQGSWTDDEWPDGTQTWYDEAGSMVYQEVWSNRLVDSPLVGVWKGTSQPGGMVAAGDPSPGPPVVTEFLKFEATGGLAYGYLAGDEAAGSPRGKLLTRGTMVINWGSTTSTAIDSGLVIETIAGKWYVEVRFASEPDRGLALNVQLDNGINVLSYLQDAYMLGAPFTRTPYVITSLSDERLVLNGDRVYEKLPVSGKMLNLNAEPSMEGSARSRPNNRFRSEHF